MNKQKIISVVLSLTLFLVSGTTNIAYAIPEAPSAPSAPTAPTAPSAPSAPTAPTAPSAPGSDNNQSPEPTPTAEPTVTPTPEAQVPTATPTPTSTVSVTPSPSPTQNSTTNETASVPASVNEDSTGRQESDKGTGDASVTTGNANSTGIVENDLNKNASAGVSNEPGGITVANTGNGTNSDNNGSVAVVDDTLTIQENNANVVNDYNGYSDTGHNSASKNNLGDSNIETGNANTSGTIVNSLNTNADGIMVSEFNIADDHMGDYVLDFAANCISGCGGSGVEVTNEDNAAFSTNNGEVDLTSNNATFQTNDAYVENNMTLAASTGYNTASKNNQGNSSIETGDANVNANVLNFANNNIAGKVIYGVVNIFGDLVGDIVMGDLPGCCGGNTTVANSGNGAGSTNTANVNQDNNDELYQFNTASIQNNLVFETDTGNNEVSKNNQGANSIQTGDTSIDAQVLNIANTNSVGDMWLVLVNEAGNWIGRIFGGEGTDNIAGSEGWEFTVDEDGQILAQNIGNGPDSENTAVVNQTTNNTTVQQNDATIVNNIDLKAVTGQNDASKNNGGDSSIKTGDAQIVANIVNFVNNNIQGTGRLFVTTVNVFGSWLGDFVTPGSHKETAQSDTNPAIGGPSLSTNNADSSNKSSENHETAVAGIEVTSAPKNNASVLSYNTASTTTDTSDDDLIASAEVENAVAALSSDNKNTININLAWALLMIPALFAIKIAKKKNLFALLALKK